MNILFVGILFALIIVGLYVAGWFSTPYLDAFRFAFAFSWSCSSSRQDSPYWGISTRDMIRLRLYRDQDNEPRKNQEQLGTT